MYICYSNWTCFEQQQSLLVQAVCMELKGSLILLQPHAGGKREWPLPVLFMQVCVAILVLETQWKVV